MGSLRRGRRARLPGRSAAARRAAVPDAPLYTRYGRNPTIEALEARLAAIEGAEAALAFGSGMAAIATTALALCGGGGHVVCVGDVYGDGA